VPKPAERIEASMAVHTKAVGKYSVKVYGNVGLSNLVRTIVQDATVEAASLTYEDWNGKNDAGQFVPNGTYYIVAAEKDYANNPSTPSLWQRSVTVDNSSPEVSSVSAAPYYFSATGATILTYTVADNQASAEVTVAVYKGTTFIKTLLDRVWKNNGTYAVPWAGDRAIADGVYTFKVSAVDLAGNISLTKEAAVYRDTTGPDAPLLSSETHNGSDYAPVSPSWSTHKSPYLSWAAVSDNGGSGVAKYEVAVDGGSWSSLGTTLSWHGTLADGSGRQVAVRGVDNLGNLGVQGMLTFEVDTTPPYFTLGPEIKSGERGTWSQTKEIKIEFAAADLTSDFASFSVLLDKSEQRNQGSPWTKTINDGVHTVEVRVYDQAGLYTDSTAYTFKADTTPPNQPVLTIGETPVGSWSNHNTPLITWSNPGDGGGSGVVSYHGFIDSIDQGVVASGWHPTLTDGTHTLFVRAIDGVGLTTNSASHTFKIDTVVPTISQPQPTNEAFNPYVDNSIRVDFTASDPAPSSGFLVANITARIKKSVVVTKDLNVIDDGSGNYHIIWDGIDNALDYVNEGAYILEVTASDGANNQAASKTTTIHLTDDQYIASGHDPRIAIDGKLYLSWVNGTSLVDSMVEARVEGDIDPGNSAYTDVEGNHLADKEFFTISNLQTVEAHAASTEEHLEIRHSINRRLDSSEVWAVRDTWGDDSGSHNYDEYLTPGTYYAYVDQIAGNGFTRVYYQARQDNLYVRSCSQDYVKKITDHLNYSQSGPTPVPSHLTGPTSVSYGGSTYQVLAHDGCIFFQKDTSTEIKIAGSSEGVDGGYGSPAICVDESGFYVAWSHGGSFDLGGHIYFQKIPHNFAPLSDNPGSRLMSYAVQTSVSSSSATATLEAPVLVSPTNNEPAVRSLRPTFTWKHQRSNQLPVTSYQLELAKNDTFSLDHQQFSKSPDSGSLAKEDATLFNYTYQIHEFDPGLDRDTYFWKVTALATNEAATSESWSFTVAPPLTLTGVTNYPNPFNPKHQSTKIRYRLGGDADEVTIRIYDVTGALVIEIPNCPTEGEGNTLLEKYHDVAWNGKNGRGELVVNGIYPFEVTARLGDTSVLARGKIAVLK